VTPGLVTVVVPTLGRTDLLHSCLAALRQDGGPDLEIVLVDQSPAPLSFPPGLVNRTVRPGRNLGFSGAVNQGAAASHSKYLAVVNDDAVVQPGWFAALVEAIEADPTAAAAQGINLSLQEPGRVDGAGIAWNKWLQAIQIGHGEQRSDDRGRPVEVFGVSGTAALYLRSALRDTAEQDEVFDPHLESYYEDVELAVRLRRAGLGALVVPQAAAHHAGSTTSATMGSRRWRLIYGNRYLVLAKLLGASFWRHLPHIALRDLVDFARALGSGHLTQARGIVLGWGRAVRHLPRFARRGSPIPLQSDLHFGPATAPQRGTSSDEPGLELSAVVVHWHTEDALRELLEAWPHDDPRFEIIVVDNGSSPPLVETWGSFPGSGRLLSPGRNLGFAGGANAGFASARAERILLLNPDVTPEPGALEALLEAFAAHPEAAGFAPALFGSDGSSQSAWQLRRLPSAWSLVGQPLPLPRPGENGAPPPPGTAIEQPAAAALALRRATIDRTGGFDPRFQPAWFEDVDFAARLAASGGRLLYWPAARFRHRLGSTVSVLGYGTFLWIYYRNLGLYLRLHHGPAWSVALRVTSALGALMRLPFVAAVRPQRAASRSEAFRGLLTWLHGAVTGWRRPKRLAAMVRPVELS
jgi:GT2 family glycosyltransferase